MIPISIVNFEEKKPPPVFLIVRAVEGAKTVVLQNSYSELSVEV